MIFIAKEQDHFVLSGDLRGLEVGGGMSIETNTLNSNAGIRDLDNGCVIAGASNAVLDYLALCPALNQMEELTYTMIEEKVIPFLQERLAKLSYCEKNDKYTRQAIIFKDKCFVLLEDYLVWEIKDIFPLSNSTSGTKVGWGYLELNKKLTPKERVIKCVRDYMKPFGGVSPILFKNTSKKGLRVLK